VNQGNAIKVLQSLRESNPQLAAHLQVNISIAFSEILTEHVCTASARDSVCAKPGSF
jgi:hypothetical protein